MIGRQRLETKYGQDHDGELHPAQASCLLSFLDPGATVDREDSPPHPGAVAGIVRPQGPDTAATRIAAATACRSASSDSF